MIGDIFIGLLLIFSAAINLLAIGAFWVTPSLRTTTNRFVANLLIVNFLSCLALSPAAFSPAITSSHTSASTTRAADGNTTGSLLNNISTLPPLSFADNDTTGSPIASIKPVENIMERYQSCALDFVVAVSVLSMLLVVLDTFIAVTDPLRYHSRISDVKAWLLIISCWILGIGVGIASAFQSSSEIISEGDANKVLSSSGCVYNTMFLLTYFLSIILTPFLLVILMYWRIFTEARESGQRMRQNGSSPLLQSALNLAASAAAATQSSAAQQKSQPSQQQQQPNSLSSPHCLLLVTSPSIQSCKQLQQENGLGKQTTTNSSAAVTSDGLTMNIDKQDYYGVNNNSNQQINLNDNYHQQQHFVYPSSLETKTFLLSSPHNHELMPFLPPSPNFTTTEQTRPMRRDSSDEESKPPSLQHQNILLTLTTACEAAAMKRNQSVKQLLTESSFYASQGDEAKFVEIRQVRSSPNLQNFYEETGTDDRRKMSQQPPETLELPNSVQASPKALRYMNSLRHRLSNASSLFKYREEGRAARISILVVIMFLLTYFPYGLLSLIHGQESIIKESSLSFLSILFVLLANLCSPFIFAYRNKRVRKGVQRLLGIDQKTNERLEKLNSLKKSYSIRLKNYRQSQLNKSFNFGSKSEADASVRNKNIRRSQTFTTCNYLTPPDANAKTSSNGISYQTQQQQQQQPKKLITSSINIREKKSILKIVCDGSRKFARGSNNCQDGQQQQQQHVVETMIGVGDDVSASQFDNQQQPTAMRPVDV